MHQQTSLGEPRPLLHQEDLRDRSPGPHGYDILGSLANLSRIKGGSITGGRIYATGEARPLAHHEDAQRSSPGCCEYDVLEAESAARPKSPRWSMKGGTNNPPGEPRPLSHIEELRDRSPGPQRYGVTNSMPWGIEGRSLSPDRCASLQHCGAKASGSRVSVQSGATFSGHKSRPSLPTEGDKGPGHSVGRKDALRSEVLQSRPHCCDIPPRLDVPHLGESSLTCTAQSRKKSGNRRPRPKTSGAQLSEGDLVPLSCFPDSPGPSANVQRTLELSCPELLKEMAVVERKEMALELHPARLKTAAKGDFGKVQPKPLQALHCEREPRQSMQVIGDEAMLAEKTSGNTASLNSWQPIGSKAMHQRMGSETVKQVVPKDCDEFTDQHTRPWWEAAPTCPVRDAARVVCGETNSSFWYVVSPSQDPPAPSKPEAEQLQTEQVQVALIQAEGVQTETRIPVPSEPFAVGQEAFLVPNARAQAQETDASTPHSVQDLFDENPYDPLNLQASLDAMSQAVNRIFLPEAKRKSAPLMSTSHSQKVESSSSVQKDAELQAIREDAWQRVCQVAQLKATAARLETEIATLHGVERADVAAITAGVHLPQSSHGWVPVD